MQFQSIAARTWLLASAAWLAASAACSRDDAVGSADAQASPAVVATAADTVLRDMSARLAGADRFTFSARRYIDTVLVGGRSVPEEAEVEVWVDRPNRIRGVSRTKETTRDFYFDGQTVTVYDRTKNLYGAAKIAGDIDQMVDRLDKEFGFPPPLGEFVVSDMYRDVLSELRTRSVGQPRVVDDSTVCTTVNWSGELADGQLWVNQRTDLPCGFVAVFRKIDGAPEVRVTFSRWNLDATIPDELFAFVPPAGARQIRMVTRTEIEQQVRAEEQAIAQQEPPRSGGNSP